MTGDAGQPGAGLRSAEAAGGQLDGALAEGGSGALTEDQAENLMQEAVELAEAVAEQTGGLGEPGRPLDKRSPFFVGMSAAAGVASLMVWRSWSSGRAACWC
jgi:hypothetical protein